VSGRVTAALGAVLGLAGLVALAVPSLTTSLPVDEDVVLLLGIVLLLGAFGEIQRRRGTELEYADTPETERVVDLPTPGDDVDRRLDRMTLTRFNELERQRLREDVREAALATIQRRDGCSREVAERALREGTWTDDPFAAAFFTRRAPDVAPTSRVRALMSTTTPFERRAVQAIDAVHRLAEADDE
jgi:hypothetical protein